MSGRLVREKGPPLRWGKPPSERTTVELLEAGVINLDKPQGPTSHQVAAWVKDILNVDKVGHGGTLDPKVTGVLPVATGKATRALDLVLRSDKEYVCLMRLHRDKEEEIVKRTISRFVGDIYQMPPMRSAVKRQMRVRTVHSIQVLEMVGREVLFRVSCDAGTYIRTLCVDIGDALGVGAHMEDLRRTRSGNMSEEEAVTLPDLKDAFVFWKEGEEGWLRSIIKPLEVLMEPLPKIVVKGTAVDALCHGADLAVVGLLEVDEGVRPGDLVALMTEKGEGVGLATAVMGAVAMVESKEGVAANIERVFMERGSYPRMW